MIDNELDKDTLSKIGQYITNQEFDKISIDDYKKIGNKIGGKKKISAGIMANLRPALVIITIIEFLIFTLLVGDSPLEKSISFGFLTLFNSFGLGFVLFINSEFTSYRKEHIIFSLFSPTFVMISSMIFQKGLFSLNVNAITSLFVLVFFYLFYNLLVFVVFNSVADKMIGYLFSRFNTIKFSEENTITFKLDADIKNNVMYEYILHMLNQFFNLNFYDREKSEKHKSIIFSSYDFEPIEPPMYNKLVRYYLFTHINVENATLTFGFFQKYFDRLLINDETIKKNILLRYCLSNVCKNIKEVKLDNFEEMNTVFRSFDNELFGKRRGSRIEKVEWLTNKYVLGTIFFTLMLLAMYYFSLFSSIYKWITSYQALASGIIGAIVVILVQFVLRQRPR
ncbi:hypothetical protein ANME2D_01501 [Candidatus Methanoperedens nitroreducens]|uniref:Uncharacterized protein n=1 Tax=Candidatus Methanoperedens nitratireducens TaxID=1392998 RepID=A0A062V8L5_9EURY|nr:hypothetical protein [Candidatus Methanoperedens nitroreducens]KCZ72099.1 hypothetical protein ANME2D_01501 [Candidatus Methanoperedens nitroreducens]MDJ1421923.1 hypothetical protein [Candidatus Methanoperedens sp.]